MSFFDKVIGIDELRFGLSRKLIALIVTAGGILTFFLPLVATTPQVMDKTEWSAYEAVTYVYQSGLVRSSSDALLFPVEIIAAYLLLPLALYVVIISRTQRKLMHIGLAGLALVIYAWTRAGETFETLFYRNYPTAELTPGKHVDFIKLLLVLSAIMGSLLVLTACEWLDGRSSPLIAHSEMSPQTTSEPELIDAEISQNAERGNDGERSRRQLHLRS